MEGGEILVALRYSRKFLKLESRDTSSLSSSKFAWWGSPMVSQVLWSTLELSPDMISTTPFKLLNLLQWSAVPSINLSVAMRFSSLASVKIALVTRSIMRFDQSINLKRLGANSGRLVHAS